MIEDIQVAVHIQLQRRGQSFGFRLRLMLNLLVQIFQNGNVLRLGICQIGSIDHPDGPVDQSFLHRHSNRRVEGVEQIFDPGNDGGLSFFADQPEVDVLKLDTAGLFRL